MPMIDLNKVPEAEMDALCETLLDAVKRFYEDPENWRKYEAWLAERKQEEGHPQDNGPSK